jgi:hypothetical protein
MIPVQLELSNPVGQKPYEVTKNYVQDSQRLRNAVIAMGEATLLRGEQEPILTVSGHWSDGCKWVYKGVEFSSLFLYYLWNHWEDIPQSYLDYLDSIEDDGSPFEELVLNAITNMARGIDPKSRVYMDKMNDPDDMSAEMLTTVHVKLSSPVTYDEHDRMWHRFCDVFDVFHLGFLLDIRWD